MNREERKSLIALFQNHVTQVSNLQFGNYVLAASLCSKTKMFADRYFSERTYYFYDLVEINFKSTSTEASAARLAWDDAYGRLLAVANSMLEEVQLDEMHHNGKASKWDMKKLITSSAFLLISSYILWSFNTWAKWGWLAQHPKRIALYLSFQLALLFVFALFFTSSKQGKFFELIGISVSIAFGIISLLG
jgi:hypothetical protein